MATTAIAQPRLFKAVGARVTPQVEWVEVQVKSVLNRVKGMPFEWSINPYRGCEHACTFCTGPETPVLMANGTHRPIAGVQPGDAIYGTVVQGFYRRYVKTHVLAHWETQKPAYRITLEDGTELIASGDHRFLTERGWKFVTGAEHGHGQRPFLTVNNKLMGVGSFSRPGRKDSDYMRGYLAGIIRGDGFVGSCKHRRPGRRRGIIYQFRLALTDVEALRRAEHYLREFDVSTTRFVFAQAGIGKCRHSVHAIRASSRSLVDAVVYLSQWLPAPSPEWYKGFLAGIFDAEGSYSRGILRISNTDWLILDHLRHGLTSLGFDYANDDREQGGRLRPICHVRVRGGLREHLRFFHTVDPAISRKRDIEGQAVKSAARLGVVAVEPLGRTLPLIDITTGTGDFITNGVISHNCYARRTHWFLDQDGVNDWSSRIFVKINAPEVLRRELASPKWTHEEVQIGTATDPYQPAEGAYKLTRQILEAMRDFGTPAGLITRSSMVVRDLDVLQQLASGPGAQVCFSIATIDERLGREIEPNAPPPLRRLEALRTLERAGVPTVVMLAPVLPGITDDTKNLTAVVEAARDYGASSLATIVLHLGEVTRDAFFEFLTHRHPELVPEYRRLYRGKYAPAPYRAQIQEVVAAIKARTGFRPRPVDPPPEVPRRLPNTPVQLQLLEVTRGDRGLDHRARGSDLQERQLGRPGRVARAGRPHC